MLNHYNVHWCLRGTTLSRGGVYRIIGMDAENVELICRMEVADEYNVDARDVHIYRIEQQLTLWNE